MFYNLYDSCSLYYNVLCSHVVVSLSGTHVPGYRRSQREAGTHARNVVLVTDALREKPVLTLGMLSWLQTLSERSRYSRSECCPGYRRSQREAGTHARNVVVVTDALREKPVLTLGMLSWLQTLSERSRYSRSGCCRGYRRSQREAGTHARNVVLVTDAFGEKPVPDFPREYRRTFALVLRDLADYLGGSHPRLAAPDGPGADGARLVVAAEDLTHTTVRHLKTRTAAIRSVSTTHRLFTKTTCRPVALSPCRLVDLSPCHPVLPAVSVICHPVTLSYLQYP